MTSHKNFCMEGYSAFSATFVGFMLAMCKRKLTLLIVDFCIQWYSGSSTQSLQIIEICLDGIETIQRVNSFSDVKITLQEIQQYFVTKRSLGMFMYLYMFKREALILNIIVLYCEQ